MTTIDAVPGVLNSELSEEVREGKATPSSINDDAAFFELWHIDNDAAAEGKATPSSKKAGSKTAWSRLPPRQRKLVAALASVLGLAIVVAAVLASSGPDPDPVAAAPIKGGVTVQLSSATSLLKLYWYDQVYAGWHSEARGYPRSSRTARDNKARCELVGPLYVT